jgi:hypothetical protein
LLEVGVLPIHAEYSLVVVMFVDFNGDDGSPRLLWSHEPEPLGANDYKDVLAPIRFVKTSLVAYW